MLKVVAGESKAQKGGLTWLPGKQVAWLALGSTLADSKDYYALQTS